MSLTILLFCHWSVDQCFEYSRLCLVFTLRWGNNLKKEKFHFSRKYAALNVRALKVEINVLCPCCSGQLQIKTCFLGREDVVQREQRRCLSKQSQMPGGFLIVSSENLHRFSLHYTRKFDSCFGAGGEGEGGVEISWFTDRCSNTCSGGH